MGRQTNLEKKAIERRQVELVRSDYNKTEKYDESHEDAKSDASRVDKPLEREPLMEVIHIIALTIQNHRH